MKVIQLHNSEEKLIKKAQKNDRVAQQALYTTHAPKMLSVCRYYVKDIHYAEDVMITGFAKVFKNLNHFRFDGSFEGWVRKIMVREAISFLRTHKQMEFSEDNLVVSEGVSYESEMSTEMLQLLIDGLPGGYKAVFVMYAVEGYSHKEIATLLQISEGTSKSQLSKARKLLKQQLELLKKRENGTV
ncbi:RNA polymerase sigma factor [Neptunitalea lumnitzerae]|uniref:RNA polymerase sigma factor n=1 Tax=Neptunitalea lumnitzerae TaxID=2965509 RepID=UPI0024933CF1|nr:sigma-70 family RNA polymerase sigma factor [Neptunitalea sp. Y10]